MAESHLRVDRWNERFAQLASDELFQPDALLEAACDGLAPGRALDLACGAGRHAIALALRGYRVTAVDFADVGLGLMLQRAQRLGCADSIDAQLCDLEADLPALAVDSGAYDLIVDVHFLHRPLWPSIRQGLRVGGRFAAALHVGHPDAPVPHRYTLAPGELEATVRGWGYKVLMASELAAQDGEAPACARIVAERVL
jgi:tellurite methyltransferase